MPQNNPFPQEPEIPSFPEYTLGSVGTVISHSENGHYIVRTEDGRVIGFPAQTVPSEDNAALDWDAWQNRAPSSPPVPAEVTRRQLLLALYGAGITRSQIAAMLAGNEPALIEYEEALTFRRDHPLIASLGGALQMDSEQIDQLFLQAAAL